MHEHDTDAMLARADSSTGLVYICNPNNPTGTLTLRKSIESFISKLPADVMILIDEAYHHFVSATSSYRSFLDYPLDDPRVVVARTFSKIYGLAGLRLGYSVSSEAASSLSALRLQNGVTIVSAKAAITALEDSAYVRMAAKRNADDRQEFMNQVNARMLRAIDSHANFVLLNPLRPSVRSFSISGKTTFTSHRRFPRWRDTSAFHSALPPKCANSGASGISCPPLTRRCKAG